MLCDFINAHLVDSGFEPVERVSIENPFNLKEFQNDKESILDVRAEAKDKRLVNIEIQSAREKFYVHRSLYYWARLYQGQLKEGEGYDTLSPVICINILDFTIFDTIKQPHTCFMVAEKNNPEYLLTGDLQLHFYEIPKYRQGFSFANRLEKWICFFQNEGTNKGGVMEILLKDDPIFARVYEKYSHFSEDKELRMAYEAREKHRRDEISMISFAEKRGLKEGIKKGIKKGVKKGIQQGLYQAAVEMRHKGLDFELIQQVTGISRKEIEEGLE